ncbi:MAG: hypothetical protein HZT43_18315 [Exiguobacterium profundum]|nr:MAG: hypothetical protein HZT43_18315 [Exiguobacterium profundum]
MSSDGLLTPKAAPLALVRAGDVSDDLEADEAAYESLKAEGGMVAPEEVPLPFWPSSTATMARASWRQEVPTW